MARCVWGVVPLVVVALCSDGSAQTSAPAEVQIRNVRWQTLPGEIGLVYAGPDGRVWMVGGTGWQGAAGATELEVGAVKGEIAGEWGKKMPVLRKSRPALFEKSGRVWFISGDGRELLGFDGKSWIEQAAHPYPPRIGRSAVPMVNGFIGDVPGHGRLISTPVNLDLGKFQMFPESTGITTFDGKTFSFLQTMPISSMNVVQVALERSGDSAVLFEQRPPKLWRFRAGGGGTWTEIPVDLGPAQGGQGSWLSLSPDGAAFLQRMGGTNAAPVRVSLETRSTGTLQERFDAELKRLGNPNAKIADAAAQAIAAMGKPVAPLIEKAMSTEPDTNTKVRLGRVRDQLATEATPQVAPRPGGIRGRGVPTPPTPTKIGNVEVQEMPTGLYYDPSGILMVSVRPWPGEAGQAQGVHLFLKDGTHKFVAGQMGIPAMFSAPAPLVTDGGKSIYFAVSGTVQRVNLAVDPPRVETLPDVAYSFVQAKGADGTLYLSNTSPMTLNLQPNRGTGAGASPVGIYKADAPDDRVALAGNAEPLQNSNTALAPTGELFATIAGKGVSRFDGTAWRPLWDADAAGMQFIPGNQGELLIWRDKHFAFLHDGERAEGDALDELLRKNAAAVAKAFRGPYEPDRFKRALRNSGEEDVADAAATPTEGGWSVAADRNGVLWLAMSRSLRVLPQPDGQWLTVDWPLESNTPGPSMVLPVGDGSVVYVYGLRGEMPATARSEQGAGGRARPPRAEPKAYLADLKNGQMEFSEAPYPDTGALFMDGGHALWVMNPRGIGPRAAARGIHVQRVGSEGVIDSFDIDETPVLLDKAGYVWLDPGDGNAKLIKEGKVVGTVAVPGGSGAKFFSDKAGSVWVWESQGLLHFESDGRSPAYRQTGSFSVPAADGLRTLAGAGLSEKGFLFITSPSRDGRVAGRSGMVINTIPIPSK